MVPVVQVFAIHGGQTADVTGGRNVVSESHEYGALPRRRYERSMVPVVQVFAIHGFDHRYPQRSQVLLGATELLRALRLHSYTRFCGAPCRVSCGRIINWFWFAPGYRRQARAWWSRHWELYHGFPGSDEMRELGFGPDRHRAASGVPGEEPSGTTFC
jgi:hypothetical protein